MKDIILDDRKQYLPNLCMVVLTLICLALIWIGGILFHNSALVSTLIGLYAIIMVLVGVIMISMAGKAFMADMRNQGIWKMRKNQGKSLLGVIGCKTTLYAGLLFITEMLYALVMERNTYCVKNAGRAGSNPAKGTPVWWNGRHTGFRDQS